MEKKTFFEKLMSDYYDDERITPARFYDCGMYTLNQLIEFNDSGEFDDIISELTDVLDALNVDLSGIDQGLNKQKNKTKTNDEVKALF